jgi:hypothetical protein
VIAACSDVRARINVPRSRNVTIVRACTLTNSERSPASSTLHACIQLIRLLVQLRTCIRRNKAIRTRGTVNFYSKRNISFWSARFSTLYHNHPRSQLLYISTLYQLPYIILYFSHTILSHRACHCLSLRTPNSAVSQEQ